MMPKPKRKVQIINIAATIPVSLFNPFSALFCDANILAALPIPAIPSPFGECIRISTTSNIAEIDINPQVKISIYFFSFLMKCALLEFNLIVSNLYNLAGRFDDVFENSSNSTSPSVCRAFLRKLRLSRLLPIINS